ncbi:protein containing ATP-binding region, ATPase-like domain protein [human gut metagenome]|uniref:Protein containing ATP-binding region, ATPase-like domain protein n=1 Tax=human gut metagenome TaxID=408170 RepID=K1TFP1_9ZZZZ
MVLSDERRIEDGKIDIQGLGPTGTMVYADPDFIHQVVYNIVDNAIKFTPPDGVIKFDIQQENDMVRVTIENTGDGIAPDALPFCV